MSLTPYLISSTPQLFNKPHKQSSFDYNLLCIQFLCILYKETDLLDYLTHTHSSTHLYFYHLQLWDNSIFRLRLWICWNIDLWPILADFSLPSLIVHYWYSSPWVISFQRDLQDLMHTETAVGHMKDGHLAPPRVGMSHCSRVVSF